MTQKDFERLPMLTGCPGKPLCDLDSLCGDHRDVWRMLQREEKAWRDEIALARIARDGAEEFGRQQERKRCISAMKLWFANHSNAKGDVIADESSMRRLIEGLEGSHGNETSGGP